jgi:hypothetical protein
MDWHSSNSKVVCFGLDKQSMVPSRGRIFLLETEGFECEADHQSSSNARSIMHRTFAFHIFVTYSASIGVICKTYIAVTESIFVN